MKFFNFLSTSILKSKNLVKKPCRMWTLRNLRQKRSFFAGYIIGILTLLYISSLYEYLICWSFYKYYVHWGPDAPLGSLITQLEQGEAIIKPINEFSYPYTFVHQEKCQSNEPIRLLFIVKSSIGNVERRNVIRNSYGYENRFSGVNIRTIFLVGMNFDDFSMQSKLEKEANINKDIVQSEFKDSYKNNTIKTMMGLHWTFHYCENVKYFFFVDDDYYVSTRNVLRFLRSPTNYPKYLEKYVVSAVNEYQEQLYAGYTFMSSMPFRFYFSKWYVSLNEYPYSHYPPYITGGAYVMSRKSLINIYYASIFTKPFRLDDVFVGMAAKKANVKLLHHPEFHFQPKLYSLEGYKYVIASHGYEDHNELHRVWTEQRSAGNA